MIHGLARFLLLTWVFVGASPTLGGAQQTSGSREFFSRLPAGELALIDREAASGQVDALFLRYLYLVAHRADDNPEMRALRERASEAGHPAAQYVLCLLESLADDETRSTANCFKASANGHPDAQAWLGLGYRLGMFGLREDSALALQFYRQAAFQGHANSSANIGDAYASGDGVKQDYQLAAHYWARAASLDDAHSLRELGRAHALGNGVQQDLDKALKYLNRAADLGDGTAQYFSGLLYQDKTSSLSAHVMFSLAVNNLKPSDIRDAAIKARATQEQYLTGVELKRSQQIVENWKKDEPKHKPFIAGTEFTSRLQKALNDRGFEAGKVDGLAGSSTKSAYTKFSETLNVGKLEFESPDIYFVGYKLRLFGITSEPATGSDVVSPRNPKSVSRANTGGSRVRSGGSGFLVNKSGHIVTNAHVVKGCQSVRVVGVAGEPVEATVVEVSEFSDLAVIKASIPSPAPIAFRGINPPQLGESIVVYGFPLAGVLSEQGNLTVGNLSALSGLRGDPSALQISAPVQPGNSGGPVLDSKGHLVGIVVSKLDALAVAGAIEDIPQNVNFAIRSSVLENLLQSRSLEYVRANPDAPELSVTALAERARLASVRIQCIGP